MTHPPRNAAAELERLAAKLEAAERDIALKEKIIDSLEAELNAAEKERDNYKSACNEWAKKTEWVQCGINDGSVPPRYLGWHRADVVADLLNAAEKECDALLADVETAHAQMMTSAAAEREACAKACEKLTKPSGPVPGHPIDAWLLATLDCAEVIRARGK